MHRMRVFIIGGCFALSVTQIGLQGLALYRDHERIIVNAEQVQQDWTRILEQYVKRALEGADILAEQAIARIGEARDKGAITDDGPFAQSLRNAVGKASADGFMLVGASGQPLLMSENSDEPSGNMAGRAWFIAHANHGVERYVGRTPFMPGEGVRFFYTRRLSDRGERFLGVLRIAFSQNLIEAFSLRADPGRSMQVALWTPAGDLVTRSGLDASRNAASGASALLDDVEIAARVRATPAGAYRVSGDAPRLVAHRNVADWPLVVTTARPMDDVMQQWWREARRAGWRSFAFAMFSAFAAGAGLLSVRAIERSHENLASALKENDGLLCELNDLDLLRSRGEELAAAQTQLRDVIDNMSEALIVFGANGRLLLWNQRLLDFFPELGPILRVGMFRHEYLERAAHILCLDLDSGDDAAAWARDQIDHFGSVRFLEQRLKDGRWVLLRQARGADGALIIVRTDITELKRREAALRSLQEAQEAQSRELAQYAEAAGQANRAKSAFLAAMSHEIRTPLTAVIGFANLLGDTPLSAEQQRHVNVLRTSSRHLLALVSDILDFSRLESGNLKLGWEPFDLHAVLGEAEAITRGLLGDKAVAVRVFIAPDAPRWAMGDSARLKQVLLNFTSNSAKFTREGEIAIKAEIEGDELAFSVHDTGIGVPEADRSRIFCAFEQVRGQGPIYRAGAGLGLSISKSLVEAMGGSIGVKDVPGRGSCFWFRIPLVRAAAPLAAGAGGQPDHAPPMRILVAEDAASSASLIEAMLVRMGHQVVLARDGAQAVERAQEAAFDLVLMDLQMPTKGGLEAAREIRALGERWRTIPIFALTAAASQEDQDAACEAGMDEFLTKPFSRDDLSAALSRAALRKAIDAV